MGHIKLVTVFSSVLIFGILIISNHFSYAESLPVVKLVESNSHPSSIPAGTVNEDWQLPDVVASCMAGPPESVYSMCPIIEWDGFTYWPYGYRDNRVGMMIVKYDDSGNVVDHWEKEGVRYVDKSTVSETDKTVIFGGEYGTIVMSWDELGITSDGGTSPEPKPITQPTKETETTEPPKTMDSKTPVVNLVKSNTNPPMPPSSAFEDWQESSLKVSCHSGPDSLGSDTCPVLNWNGFTYWAFSHSDNRSGMTIVKYNNDSGCVDNLWEKTGARYLYKITVDDNAKTVTFWGQADSVIEMSWDELSSSVDVCVMPEEIVPVASTQKEDSIEKSTSASEEGGGCLIATATFGSELSTQVQFLRELRDNKVLATASGTAFMTGFNQFYYSFSPTIADWERQNPMFKETVKAFITPMISTLSIMQLIDNGSEEQVIGLGISVIALNLGMYVVAPVVAIVKIRSLIRKN
ncbi:MAG: CFI-box-CTERM domain-containing protein [Nitrososphaerales archaeon]